jgi:CHAT domain-containing protein
MFASPFSYPMGISPSGMKRHAELCELGFKDEAKRIKNKAKESRKAIIFQKSVLTTSRLLEMLKKEPSVIHISCHGLTNIRDNLGSKFEETRDQGNFLIFETDQGESNLVSHKKLKELLKNEQSRIKEIDLVFLAACTSESNGQLFKELGARHVICIVDNQLVRDDAIIVFTEQFYSKLFECQNVCMAYKHAKSFLDCDEHRD